MAKKVVARDLLNIIKADRKALNHLRYGAHLGTTTGYAFDDLVQKSCKDRFMLAIHWLRVAQSALAAAPPQYRLAVGRAYYAMYHAARVTVFFVSKGDDHEAHSALPGHLPDDFPNSKNWENDLKDARAKRNEADYDPYPRNDRAFSVTAYELTDKAEKFLPQARLYLRRKGCNV